jgi:hypothetical protein
MGLDKFSDALDLLKGFHVNLFVGEDVFKGKLIGVETDHVVLETENKYIFYYNIEKIQAVTKNTKQFQPEKSTVHFQKTQSLKELLHTFQHSWVTILSLNKQKFSGVLSEIDEDFATLINGEERILIKLTHIANILKGFIKEEETKPKDSKSKETKSKEVKSTETKSNDNESDCSKDDSKNKDDKKDKEKEKDTKEEETENCYPKEYSAEKMPDNSYKPAVITTSSHSEKKTIASLQQDHNHEMVKAVEGHEPNHTMVWSQPIKTESNENKPADEQPFKSKKHQSEGETEQNSKNEMTKPNTDLNHKEKKTEEPTMNKSKQGEHGKETKTVKEAASIKMDTKPVTNKEVTTSKPQDKSSASKPVVSQNAAPKKTENNTKKAEPTNDTQKVWKQKDKEKRAFRFTGEPVAKNSERAFPFAGWPTPNKTKRTFRF